MRGRPTISETEPLVLTVRRFAIALMLVLVTAGDALANPMLLIDANSGEVLYEDQAGQPWHPASLTKLMTAFVAFEAIAEGRVGLDTPVVMSKKAVSQAPAVSGLKAGAAISMKDALYIMLVKSANDVAWAVGETIGGGDVKAFVAEMNATAKKLGLSATHFGNPNGLNDESQVTTARDLAILSLYIRQNYPAYLPIFQTEKVVLGKTVMETNNDLLTHFAGTTGMKTGYICASGLNIVATVERNGRTLLGVVLGGSSGRERGEMAAEMFLRGFSGALPGTGKSVMAIANIDAPPFDMRPLICGKQAKDYVAQREAAFPLGLKGQPSYLTDLIPGTTYVATDLGQVRNGIPLPRPRPGNAPVPTAAAIIDISPVQDISPIEDIEAPVANIAPVAGLDAGAPIPMPTLVR